MQRQRSITQFQVSMWHILQMPLASFVIYGSIWLLAVVLITLESHLAGHVHMTTNLFWHASGHTTHASSAMPRLVEGPGDSPIAEGPGDSPVGFSALVLAR